VLPTADPIATARRKNLWPVKVPVVLHFRRPFGTKALASGTDFVDSANEGEDSISRIDLAPRRVTMLQLLMTPHNAQVSRDGWRLFSLGSMAGQVEKALPGAAPGGPRTRCREGGRGAGDLRCDARLGRRQHPHRCFIAWAAHEHAPPRNLRGSDQGQRGVRYRRLAARRRCGRLGGYADAATDHSDTRGPQPDPAVCHARRKTRLYCEHIRGDGSTIDTATQRVVGSVRVGRGPGGVTCRPGVR